MEARKREMLEGAASAEKARMRTQHDGALSVDSSRDEFGSEDIVEEDIERAEEESDVDEAPSPAHHGVGLLGNSLGESGQELSVSDRSVDGSMALEGFDVVETVGR
uniref:Uncharacterized protein n=1 Tax=Hemiselmis andersenii TaxID=464988 RepID=A0A6U4RU56_HEMAN|mmetsp:Transcript_11480/g.27818  ORF Transcript_11480/g.27818 Transcript_11480/m.27818 type:complete len:106 (+) Transcript_11480:47-364(+)